MRTRFLLHCIVVLTLCTSLSAGDYLHASRVSLDREGERWAKRTLKKLSLEEKIGQMFMIRVLSKFVNIEDPDYQKLREHITRYHLGSILLTVPVDGPFLLKSEPYEAAMLINGLQREPRIPLIVAADFERGPSMRLNGVTPFPYAMAFGAAGKPDFGEGFLRSIAPDARVLRWARQFLSLHAR